MDIFLMVLALITLFVLLALPSVVWYLKDRAIDRQLRRAERERIAEPGGERTRPHTSTATLRRESITLRH
ncbi:MULTISPECIES: hypothetical protein [unclassified Streptomyces]|uniref:hypothetical protein n=1 Tax=unclassified Streptomyces TaxID=2593676 RepID=UPI00114C8A83|nr:MULTISPECIES: hypothetical protein [unclassified Streptomyces]MYZ35001.1 hypothetical protein [Streptomyces sp. SID4917]